LAGWAAREALFDESMSSHSAEEFPRIVISRGRLVEPPPGSAPDAESWDDIQWRDALVDADNAEMLASQLRVQSEAEPERFVRFLIESSPPVPGPYVSAILQGASQAKVPSKVDIPALEHAVDRVAPDGTHTVGIVTLISRSMERSPTIAERDAVLRYVDTPATTPPLGVAGPRGDWIPADLEWRHRVDAVAASALGRWINEHPDEIAHVDRLIVRAITEKDLVLAVALIDGLRWVLPRSQTDADHRVLRLLQAFHPLAESHAISAYTEEAWGRGRPSLPAYWQAAASAGSGSQRAGIRWTVNIVLAGRSPTVEEVERLPTATQAGVGEALANFAGRAEHQLWVVPLLAHLLERGTQEVHAAARQWAYTVTRPRSGDDSLGPAPIPTRFLDLIPATVRRTHKLMDARELLLALAAGTASQAREACHITSGLLPTALPITDLAHGYDVASCIPIASRAHETFGNEGMDARPALDLLDQLVQHNPEAVVRDLTGLQ
jgi:hypothetical protein